MWFGGKKRLFSTSFVNYVIIWVAAACDLALLRCSLFAQDCMKKKSPPFFFFFCFLTHYLLFLLVLLLLLGEFPVAESLMSCEQMKSLHRVLPKPSPHWVGDGFHVFPVFADLAFSKSISPFLMFDHGAPKYFEPTKRKLGVGFETVTIAYEGEVEHGDSVGNKGVIRQGDCQWMTAAAGIIHEEFHSREFAKKGGMFEMAQLWVNLPAKYKMIPPRYQPLRNNDIPRVELPDGAGTVKLYAGELAGTKGSANTFTPVNVWDVTIPKTGQPVKIPIPADHNTLLFVRQGTIRVQDKEMVSAQVAHFNMDGDHIEVENTGDAPADLLVLSGVPIDEPIAARGPFVMNTPEEIQQANVDFRSGRMGQPF